MIGYYSLYKYSVMDQSYIIFLIVSLSYFHDTTQ